MTYTFETETLRYILGADAVSQAFVDRASGKDWCRQAPRAPCASVRKAGKVYPATSASATDGTLLLRFGDSGLSASLRLTPRGRWLAVEVLGVEGEGAERLTFVDIPLTARGTLDEPFAACVLALNLQTNVEEIPGPASRLCAWADARFGFAGAAAAIVAVPAQELRGVLKEVVSASPDLPQSAVAGPWALDNPANRGSYVFNFTGIRLEEVDEWIRLCDTLGVDEIDFHGGSSFRFGDCRPNPAVYPEGLASVRAVNERLHAAGILAGLHTYACFIAKDTPWVTPVPDPRLGKDARFTLAEDLSAEGAVVPVVESTQGMSTVTGFFQRNSVTLQIDDELITYSGLAREPPYAFTGCQRGALGTRPAAHAKGSAVHHLRECFGLFVPDGDSTLLEEVAARTAEAFNEGGFDMIYLDALDGEDAIAGPEYGWHYGSKFAWGICRRLRKPAIMEMSTFHHHLWYIRSRMGAWDHPNRGHKAFIDLHAASNRVWERSFLPTNLGWWAFKTWNGAQSEPTYPDDIEYLCGKALALGAGLSVMGITPGTTGAAPALPRLAAVMRRYETLRRAGYFTDAVKAQIGVPGREFTLEQDSHGEWRFQAVHAARHRVAGLDGWSDSWAVRNPSSPQPCRIRVEALLSVEPYDSPNGVTVAGFAEAGEFAETAARAGVTAALEPSAGIPWQGRASGRFTAASTLPERAGSWARAAKAFSPPADFSGREALGVWVHGDGQGEVLNLQLTSPPHLSSGVADHYLVVDFTGWRYFELVEPEGARHAEYSWPYGDPYSIYREGVHFANVSRLTLYANNLPPGGSVECCLSPVRALPVVKARFRNPAITVGDRTIVFPVEMESGSVLEFRPPAECRVYGPAGELLEIVTPQGEAPILEAGENRVRFSCEGIGPLNPRACVTVAALGDTVAGMTPPDQVRWELLRREVEDPRPVQALDGTQNTWEVLCRPDGDGAVLAAEITVDRAAGEGTVHRPSLAVNGRRAVFPVALTAGERLVVSTEGACRVLDREGKPRAEAAAETPLPHLRKGTNRVEFAAEALPAGGFQVTIQLTKVYGHEKP